MKNSMEFVFGAAKKCQEKETNQNMNINTTIKMIKKKMLRMYSGEFGK